MSAPTRNLIRRASELDSDVSFYWEGRTYTVVSIADCKIGNQPAVSMVVKNANGAEHLLELKSATVVSVIPFSR